MEFVCLFHDRKVLRNAISRFIWPTLSEFGSPFPVLRPTTNDRLWCLFFAFEKGICIPERPPQRVQTAKPWKKRVRKQNRKTNRKNPFCPFNAKRFVRLTRGKRTKRVVKCFTSDRNVVADVGRGSRGAGGRLTQHRPEQTRAVAGVGLLTRGGFGEVLQGMVSRAA